MLLAPQRLHTRILVDCADSSVRLESVSQCCPKKRLAPFIGGIRHYQSKRHKAAWQWFSRYGWSLFLTILFQPVVKGCIADVRSGRTVFVSHIVFKKRASESVIARIHRKAETKQSPLFYKSWRLFRFARNVNLMEMLFRKRFTRDHRLSITAGETAGLKMHLIAAEAVVSVSDKNLPDL